MRREIVSIVSALLLVLSLGLVMVSPSGVGAAPASQEFLVSGSFVVPAGVTSIIVEAWGAGGAGGGSTDGGRFSGRGGGGGGGGAYVRSTLPVVAGTTLQVVVGAGGMGFVGADGADGAASEVWRPSETWPSVSAAGGKGGTANTEGGRPPGGNGGQAVDSIGDIREPGEDGKAGGTCSTSISGEGGAGAHGGGAGGAALTGRYTEADGNPGGQPGGGGGGARTARNGVPQAGGAGAAGKVVITWEVTPPAKYPLTMAVSPLNSGTATDLTGGSPYAAGTVVNIQAVAKPGYEFVNWGAPAGTLGNVNSATTTFTMPAQAVTVTAYFKVIPEPPAKYPLTMAVSPLNSGTATDLTGTSPYTAGTVVNIQAVAKPGYEFVNWGAPAGTLGNVNSATTTFTMPAQAVTVTAYFKVIPEPPTKYWLYMAASPFCCATATDLTGTSPYAAGTVVNIQASANPGYQFANWSAPAGTFGSVTSPTTTFTMPAQDVTVTAHCQIIPEPSPPGPCPGPCPDPCPGPCPGPCGGKPWAPAPHGFSGTVSYTSPPGPVPPGALVEAYVSDVKTASTTVDSQNRYELLVPGAGGATVTFRVDGVLANESATWESARLDGNFNLTVSGSLAVQYALNISSTAGGSVTTPGEAAFTYDQGTAVSIVAQPAAGYQFVNWTGNVGAIASVNAASTTITMNGNYAITASFAELEELAEPEEPAQGPPIAAPVTRSCFIATAAYGSPSCERIDVLREFRDVVLLESAVGSRFVTLYYRFSPPVADVIAGSDLLATVVRELLVDPVVSLIEAAGAIWRN
jgi:uncharacterized repeat protein (TIGR02543 family)